MSIAGATTFATAAKYSPVTGLLPAPDSVAGNSGQGGQFPSFKNPGAPSLPGNGAAPASSINGAGAFTPDWANLINNDADLVQTKADLSAGGIADASQRDAAIQRAITQFGSVPDLASLAKQLGLSLADVQNTLGPGIQQLAKENTDAGLSTKARLGQANTDAIRQIKNELNKRGLLNSGETGYQLDRQNTGYRQAESDATNKLLDYLDQYQQGYLAANQTRQGQLATATSAAADRQFANNAGTSGVTATYSYTDGAGNHVYTGPDGSLYNADGTPYTAPPQPPPVDGGTANVPALGDFRAKFA